MALRAEASGELVAQGPFLIAQSSDLVVHRVEALVEWSKSLDAR